MATIGTTAGRSGFEDSEVERYLRRRRVLLVDDDASMRVLCALNLRAAEFEVSEAADGLQGFEQATRHPPDLILSDLRMPGLDGFALAEALRHDESTRSVPVVFLSGETGVAERMRAYALGVAGFVTKPFEPAALVALLAGVIERTAAAACSISARRPNAPCRLWYSLKRFNVMSIALCNSSGGLSMM